MTSEAIAILRLPRGAFRAATPAAPTSSTSPAARTRNGTLLCGLAKARYYLLTGEMVTGAEAERIGLVSKAVPRKQVLDEALRVADALGTGSQLAIRWTRRALNNWLRMAGPTFDASLALEMLGFSGPDPQEGLDSFRERRAPNFPKKAPF